jgi:hypothetical protein
MSSIYYNPEASEPGLKVFGCVEKDLSYEFDMVVVWEDKDGNLYWATDSGCSCPTPFENHDFASLDRLNKQSLASFESYIKYYPDAESMLRKVETHLRKRRKK